MRFKYCKDGDASLTRIRIILDKSKGSVYPRKRIGSRGPESMPQRLRVWGYAAGRASLGLRLRLQGANQTLPIISSIPHER